MVSNKKRILCNSEFFYSDQESNGSDGFLEDEWKKHFVISI